MPTIGKMVKFDPSNHVVDFKKTEPPNQLKPSNSYTLMFCWHEDKQARLRELSGIAKKKKVRKYAPKRDRAIEKYTNLSWEEICKMEESANWHIESLGEQIEREVDYITSKCTRPELFMAEIILKLRDKLAWRIQELHTAQAYLIRKLELMDPVERLPLMMARCDLLAQSTDSKAPDHAQQTEHIESEPAITPCQRETGLKGILKTKAPSETDVKSRTMDIGCEIISKSFFLPVPKEERWVNEVLAPVPKAITHHAIAIKEKSKDVSRTVVEHLRVCRPMDGCTVSNQAVMI